MNDIWRMISLGLTRVTNGCLFYWRTLSLINQLWGVRRSGWMFLHGASLLVLLLYFRRYNQLTASVFGHGYQVQRHVVICLLLTTYHRTYCPLVRTATITVAQRAFGRLFLVVTSFFWSWPFFPPSGAGRYLWYGYSYRCFQGLAVLPGVRGPL